VIHRKMALCCDCDWRSGLFLRLDDHGTVGKMTNSVTPGRKFFRNYVLLRSTVGGSVIVCEGLIYVAVEQRCWKSFRSSVVAWVCHLKLE
jgi:hypothetical protein